MTINLSRSDVQASVSRVKECCDQMGIRLGKGEDKAQKLICSVLNEPNWHVIIKKASSPDISQNSEASPSQSLGSIVPLHTVCNHVLKFAEGKKVEHNSMILMTCRDLLKMDSIIDFIGAIADIAKVLRMTSEFLKASQTSSLDEKKDVLAIVGYFFDKLLRDMPDCIPNSAINDVRFLAVIDK